MHGDLPEYTDLRDGGERGGVGGRGGTFTSSVTNPALVQRSLSSFLQFVVIGTEK